ncbi:MAG TPA: nuclease-related domain-containing protein [Acidimicrobiales bacterium]|nr:nuclease-related domain-containing protein [Acidimicrobiales bacterium]
MSGGSRPTRLPGAPDPAAGASAEARSRSLASPPTVAGAEAPLGRLLGPVGTKPSPDARAWSRGAAGERATAQVLDPLRYIGWEVLHDRRLPGAANLDHLLIGPGGVWVVDSKSYRGRIVVLRDGRLWYAGRRLGPVLDVVQWAAGVVSDTLGVPVSPALCVHGAGLPVDPLRWDSVVLASAAVLRRLLVAADQRPGHPLGELAAIAFDRFPPAYRR